MSKFNRVIIMGHLVKDPEFKMFDSGRSVVKFSIGVNGFKAGEVFFFDVDAWNKLAEDCADMLYRGSGVVVDGELRQDRWEGKDGKMNSRVKITANKVEFLKKSEKKDNHDERREEEDPF